MATELLHDHILRLAFLADTDRPAQLSTEDLFWKLGDPHLPLPKIKECLEWLVQQGDMTIDRSKYGLSKAKFFDLKAQFAHLAPRGIAIWLAPIAPIHVPLPSSQPLPATQVAATEPPSIRPNETLYDVQALGAEAPETLMIPEIEEVPLLPETLVIPEIEEVPHTPETLVISEIEEAHFVPENLVEATRLPENPVAAVIEDSPAIAATNSATTTNMSSLGANAAAPQPSIPSSELQLHFPRHQRQVLWILLSAQVLFGILLSILNWTAQSQAIIGSVQLALSITVMLSILYLYQRLRKSHFTVHPNAQDQ
jgi:hypothetical protein